MDFKIEKNKMNGGECCRFEHKGNKYYADSAYVPFCGMETMIFEINPDETIDWSGVYTDRSGKSLLECLNEFTAE